MQLKLHTANGLLVENRNKIKTATFENRKKIKTSMIMQLKLHLLMYLCSQ
jgi:hypothetical protein